MGERCDYCDRDLGQTFMLRAVGFIYLDGIMQPSVRAWCGREDCVPDDDLNPEAAAVVQAALIRQRGQA